MCRIFGLVGTARRRDELVSIGSQLCAALTHGGPDGDAVLARDGVLLGSTRLAISDPDGGWQPFSAHGWTVVFNGEIYNVDALRARLADQGRSLRTGCDGELLPHLLAQHGPAATGMLDGMFAFAALHEPSGRLVLARDPMGIKPLFLFADGTQLGFASEIGPLLRLRDQPVRIDLDSLERYFRMKAVFGAQRDDGALGDPTIAAGVLSLPPGGTLVWEADRGARLVCEVGPTDTWDHAVDATDLPTLFDDVVASMVPLDVDFGVMVSGGLDSGIVARLAAAHRRRPSPLQAFTVAPAEHSAFDELPHAREVARYVDAHTHVVRVGSPDIVKRLPDVVAALGQPNSDPISLSTYLLFESVREQGLPVILTGDGSDEFFGGYDRLRALGATGDLAAYVDALAGVPGGWLDGMWRDDVRDEVRHARRPDALTPDADGAPSRSRAGRLRRALEFEQRHRMPAYHLMRVDHLSAAHGVEARVPFCRPAVAALCASLEPAQMFAGDRSKVALTVTALRERWVPASIAARPKQPFTFRLSEQLSDDATLSWVREVLTDPSSGPWFAPERVEATVADFETKRTEPLAHAVWALLVLVLWQTGVAA